MAWFLWGSGRRYSGAVLALLVLAGCVAPPRAPAEPAVTAPTTAPAAQPITAVLAAGDASIGAFDNAIDYLHDMLETRAVRGSSTRLLSARR